MMKTVLLVVAPFADHRVGDLITETAAMEDIQGGAHAHDVIQVIAPCAVAALHEEI